MQCHLSSMWVVRELEHQTSGMDPIKILLSVLYRLTQTPNGSEQMHQCK